MEAFLLHKSSDRENQRRLRIGSRPSAGAKHGPRLQVQPIVDGHDPVRSDARLQSFEEPAVVLADRHHEGRALDPVLELVALVVTLAPPVEIFGVRGEAVGDSGEHGREFRLASGSARKVGVKVLYPELPCLLGEDRGVQKFGPRAFVAPGPHERRGPEVARWGPQGARGVREEERDARRGSLGENDHRRPDALDARLADRFGGALHREDHDPHAGPFHLEDLVQDERLGEPGEHLHDIADRQRRNGTPGPEPHPRALGFGQGGSRDVRPRPSRRRRLARQQFPSFGISGEREERVADSGFISGHGPDDGAGGHSQRRPQVPHIRHDDGPPRGEILRDLDRREVEFLARPIGSAEHVAGGEIVAHLGVRHRPREDHTLRDTPLARERFERGSLLTVSDDEELHRGIRARRCREAADQMGHAVPWPQASRESGDELPVEPQPRANGSAVASRMEQARIDAVRQDPDPLRPYAQSSRVRFERGRYDHQLIRATHRPALEPSRDSRETKPAEARLLVRERRVHLEDVRHAQAPREEGARDRAEGIALVHDIRPPRGGGMGSLAVEG